MRANVVANQGGHQAQTRCSVRPDDLRSFLDILDRAGQLARIRAPVDPHLEMAAIINRVSKGAGRGRALFFEEVKGSHTAVVANLFGAMERISWALGTTDLTHRVESLAADLCAWTGISADQALARLCGSRHYQPRLCAQASFGRDCTAAGLTALPILKFWPQDGGRYLTLGQTITAGPSGHQNYGMYRIQVLDKRRAALHCRPGTGASRHLASWAKAGKPMPVAVVLGGPPVLTWAAGLSLPPQVSEVAFSAYLTKRPLTLSQCYCSDLLVPTTAEFVIEGEIRPGKMVEEGPFGNHTGTYAGPGLVPELTIHAIHARDHAIYPTTLVGPPPMENLQMAEAAVQLMLPLLRHDLPWIKALHMPPQGIYHRGAMVAVDPDTKLSFTEVAKHLQKNRFLKNARLLVLFDAGTPLQDPAQLYWQMINSIGWRGRIKSNAQRLIIDARRPENWVEVAVEPVVLRRVLDRWGEFGLDK